MLDVPAKLSARVGVRRRAWTKTDATDAHAVVMAALRDRNQFRELSSTEELVVPRLLADRRDELSWSRAQGLNRLHWLMTELVPGGVPVKKSVPQIRISHNPSRRDRRYRLPQHPTPIQGLGSSTPEAAPLTALVREGSHGRAIAVLADTGAMETTFDLVLRGYDRQQVDHLLEQAEHALASDRWHERKPVLDALRSANLQQRLRGYDRDQVDRVIQELIQKLS